MSKVERFEDLEMWQLARTLTGKIYKCASERPFARDLGFKDQICRASVSIVSNIAEGFERRTTSQFINFLDIAAGSAGEVCSQLYIALDLGYITNGQFSELIDMATRISQMLTRFIQYLHTHKTAQRSNSPAQPSNHPTI